MTDLLSKSSLKWAKCLRQVYPTLVFYFCQTYDQTIVIYYLDGDRTIKCMYTKCVLADILTPSSHCEVPLALQPHFTLRPQGNNTFILPGLTDQTVWELTAGGKLVQGNRCLVSTVGVVQKETHALECLHLVCIETIDQKRQLTSCRMECTETVKTLISDMQTGICLTTLKSVVWGTPKTRRVSNGILLGST